MRPRVIFILLVAAIAFFGLAMIYSASSVESLTKGNSAQEYLIKQGMFLALFSVVAVGMARFVPIDFYRGAAPWLAWLAIILLIAVRLGGTDAGGAQRWIILGPFSLQPGELAKPAIVVLMASALSRYYVDGERSLLNPRARLYARPRGLREWAEHPLVLLALTVILVVAQPDLGTTIILVGTVFAMAFLSGLAPKVVCWTFGLGFAAALAFIGLFPWRLERLKVIFHPWEYQWGAGYQNVMAIMAFASGGLFGRGFGNSTIKYNFLPEAHNDFILAVIGEELGFVGTMVFIAAFLAMVVMGMRIAERARDPFSRMVAAGSSLCLGIQLFVNILGILGAIPMTGKPIPFVSYGGSSLLASMIFVALIVRVSIESNVASAATARRSLLRAVGESPQDAVSSHMGRSSAGEAHARSERYGARGAEPRRGASAERSRRGFSVVEGGAAAEERPPSGRGGYNPRSVPLAGRRPAPRDDDPYGRSR